MITTNRHLSFGTFQTYIQPNQRYGLSLGGKMAGLQMDIDSMRRAAVSKENSLDELRGFILAQGPRQSANEHLIPEALFDDPATTEKEAEAISAVKALQIAQQQGQKIFTLNQSNLAAALPQLSHRASVIEDVQNAINAGKVVTISQSQISYKGWTGTGYVIVDPKTGAGAYLIGGGMDGAAALTNGLMVGSALGLAVLVEDLPVTGFQLWANAASIGLLAGLIAGTVLAAKIYNWGDYEKGCFILGLIESSGVVFTAVAASMFYGGYAGGTATAFAMLMVGYFSAGLGFNDQLPTNGACKK